MSGADGFVWHRAPASSGSDVAIAAAFEQARAPPLSGSSVAVAAAFEGGQGRPGVTQSQGTPRQHKRNPMSIFVTNRPTVWDEDFCHVNLDVLFSCALFIISHLSKNLTAFQQPATSGQMTDDEQLTAGVLPAAMQLSIHAPQHLSRGADGYIYIYILLL